MITMMMRFFNLFTFSLLVVIVHIRVVLAQEDKLEDGVNYRNLRVIAPGGRIVNHFSATTGYSMEEDFGEEEYVTGPFRRRSLKAKGKVFTLSNCI